MSDLQLLFAVLAGLYGWECACWLRRGSIAFTTWLGRTWRPAHPGSLVGNQRGGFVLAAPLPPLGTLLTATPFPLSLSPEAALAFVSTNINPGWRANQSGRLTAWDALREVRVDGRKVVVNGEVWLASPSPSHARWIAAKLLQISKLKPDQRASAIRDFAVAILDPIAVEKRWQEFRARSRHLRWFGNALFAYVFLVAPVVLRFVGLGLSWMWLLMGLFALATATAILFRRAYHALYPDAEDERFTHTLTIALSPANAMRAHDALSRPLLEQFHPLAVAKVFLPDADFRSFARRVLLDLRYPAQPDAPSGDAVARNAATFWRVTVQEAAEAMLKRGGIEPDGLCHPPARVDETCHTYCPRCGAQFTSAEGRCADCGGLVLKQFA